MSVADPPLTGRTVVICRPPDSVGPLLDQVRALGATAVALPLIRQAAPADDGRALADAVDDLASYEWVVVTSAKGVAALTRALAGRPWGGPTGSPKLAVVGSATEAAARRAGLNVDLVPPTATAADLAAALPAPAGSRRVLAPLAEAATDDLAVGLVAKGYRIDRVDAYRMVAVEAEPGWSDTVAGADAVVVTAPSIVDRLVEVAGPAIVASNGRNPVMVCIGPRTAARAIAQGVDDPVVATVHDADGIVDALFSALAPADVRRENQP